MSSGGVGFKFGGIILLALLLLLLGSGINAGEKKAEGREERAEEMCSLMEGVGECRVMMTYYPDSDEERVYAVLVLCEGAESLSVRERITSLFCSLYGIGSHKVEIQKLN